MDAGLDADEHSDAGQDQTGGFMGLVANKIRSARAFGRGDEAATSTDEVSLVCMFVRVSPVIRAVLRRSGDDAICTVFCDFCSLISAIHVDFRRSPFICFGIFFSIF